MAEGNGKAKSAVEQLKEEWKKKDMEYKTPADVERVFYIVASLKDLKDTTNLSHLVGSLTRELRGLELKQKEVDEKEDKERAKEMADAVAKDNQAAKEAKDKEEEATHQGQSQRESQSQGRSSYTYTPPERRM
jgi:hypothetical protein